MSVEDTLKARGSRYGKFEDNARTSEKLMEIIRNTPGYENFSDVHRAATWIMMQKLSRALAGDPNYEDNWHDIGGYAKLVEGHCKKLNGKIADVVIPAGFSYPVATTTTAV